MPDGTGVSFAADSSFTMGNHPSPLRGLDAQSHYLLSL
jgi:hypothetical protein